MDRITEIPHGIGFGSPNPVPPPSSRDGLLRRRAESEDAPGFEAPEKRAKTEETPVKAGQKEASENTPEPQEGSPLSRQVTLPMEQDTAGSSDRPRDCLTCGGGLLGTASSLCTVCGRAFHDGCLVSASHSCTLCATLKMTHVYGGTVVCGSSRKPIAVDVGLLSGAQTTPQMTERMLCNLKRLQHKRAVDVNDASCVTWDGDREENQDVGFTSAVESLVKIYSIFDGHGVGGQLAAQFATEELVKRCVLHRLALPDCNDVQQVVESMRQAFLETQAALLKLLSVKELECGTTAVVAQMVGDTLVVANVGDSRAILVRKKNEDWHSRALSRDHSFSREDECQRIRGSSRGEIIMGAGNVARVVPGGDYPKAEIKRHALALAMTRALGHPVLSQFGVSSEPEFVLTPMAAGDRLIIASDGLWDVLPNEEVCLLCSYRSSSSKCSQALLKIAREKYHQLKYHNSKADNTTVAVAYLCEVAEDGSLPEVQSQSLTPVFE